MCVCVCVCVCVCRRSKLRIKNILLSDVIRNEPHTKCYLHPACAVHYTAATATCAIALAAVVAVAAVAVVVGSRLLSNRGATVGGVSVARSQATR